LQNKSVVGFQSCTFRASRTRLVLVSWVPAFLGLWLLLWCVKVGCLPMAEGAKHTHTHKYIHTHTHTHTHTQTHTHTHAHTHTERRQRVNIMAPSPLKCGYG